MTMTTNAIISEVREDKPEPAGTSGAGRKLEREEVRQA